MTGITITCEATGQLIKGTISGAELQGFFQWDVFGFTTPPSTTVTSTFVFTTRNADGHTLDVKSSNIFMAAVAGTLNSNISFYERVLCSDQPFVQLYARG